MHDLYNLDSTANISQPPVPLGVLNSVTPKAIKTALIDEQTDKIRYDGDVFAFTLATQFAGKAYQYADELRAAGKKVIMGGIHVTVRPEEAMRHADAVVTGEAEILWPTICADLLAGTLKERYTGSPTPPSQMVPTDYRFFGERPYLTPASLFATRGCNHRCSFCVSSHFMGSFRAKPLGVIEREIDQLQELYPDAYLQFTDDNLLADRNHASEVLALLRRKKRRFVTMVTLDQLCDGALMQEMAYAGCLGVAVGVESVDDDNCLSVGKRQNVSQPFPEAVSRANELGIQVGPPSSWWASLTTHRKGSHEPNATWKRVRAHCTTCAFCESTRVPSSTTACSPAVTLRTPGGWEKNPYRPTIFFPATCVCTSCTLTSARCSFSSGH